MKILRRAKPAHAAACPSCGCPLQDSSWRQCPRCRQELHNCRGCGNRGKHCPFRSQAYLNH